MILRKWKFTNRSQIVPHGSKSYKNRGLVTCGTISELPFSSISSESLNFPSENQRFWENGCSQIVPHGSNPYPVSVWRHRELFDFSTFWQKCKNHSFHRGFWHVKPHVSLGFWSHFSNAYVFLGFLHFWYFLQKPLQNQWFCKIKKVKNDRLQNSLCIFAKPLQNQCEQTLCFTRVAGRWDDLWPTTFPLLHTCTTFWAAQKMKVPNWRKLSKTRPWKVRTDRRTEMNRGGGRPPLVGVNQHELRTSSSSIVQPLGEEADSLGASFLPPFTPIQKIHRITECPWAKVLDYPRAHKCWQC